MKLKFFTLIIYICMLITRVSYSYSVVYNFRIAQITKQPIAKKLTSKSASSMILAFNIYEQKYTGGIANNFAGCMPSVVYNLESLYARIDFAFANIHQKTNGCLTFSDTESDDILISLGHAFKINEKSKVTLSGLLGVPTHPIFTLEHVAFGYGQTALGIQLDGIYNCYNDFHILCGTRYLYFVPKNALDAAENSYTFSIGNVADLLIALKNGWGKHELESGYARRWDFGSSISPAFDDIVAKTNYDRNSFYLVYKYHFKKQNISHRLLLDVAYGFDSKPKNYGNKHIFTIWGSWAMNF
jgi:hypothetical protein